MKYFSFFALLIAANFSIAQPLIMNPSISSDGSKIAFSYQGDIWTVPAEGGRVDRITIHEGYETNPVWSADGEKIVFTSDRYGNYDVFSVDAMGGTPVRHTYHSANDYAYSVSGYDEILFITNRIYAQVEREDEIYSVRVGQGTPTRFMDALGFDPVLSPDGSKVAFVRGTCRTAREAYRGPANRNIWVFDKNTGEYDQLTDYDGNDFSPRWIDNNTLTYITSRSGKYNVHRITLDGTDSQITANEDFGVFSYGLSPSTGQIVYQSANKVMIHDISSGSASEIDIDVSSDYRFDPVVTKTVTNNVDGFSVSPNGKYSAYIHRGEVFLTRNDKEDSRSVKITDGPARDRGVEWLTDETLLFISDGEGQNELYLARSSDPEEKDLFKTLKREIVRLTDTPDEEEFGPVVSPDGKKIALRRGRGKLIVADISEEGELSNEITLLDGWDTPGNVSWSPDSKWLAYGLSDLNFNQEVFIHAADNSREPENVTLHPKYDGNPVWSPDGSKLGFVSMRNNSDNDIWFVWLKKEDWEKSQEAWKREEFSDDDDEKDDDENGQVEVEIDFDRIYERAERVTGFPGAEVDFAFDPSGEMIYYATGPDWRRNFKVDRGLYKIKWDGSENKEISGVKNPSGLRLDEKEKHLYFGTSGGVITRLNLSNEKSERLTVRSRININYKEELDQIFEEGWRALNEGFYDPEFHGRDWEALREKYKPIALSASTKEDFQYVYNLMLGQLNASHMGMYRGENQKETQEQRTGLIGIEGENVENGYRVTSVLSDSPADKIGSKLFEGDVITSVNQETITSETNFYSLLSDTRNEKILLTVNRGNKTEEVVIWPASSLRRELYRDWVNTRRKLTEEYSNGRLGYLHIQGMNWRSFERFERELMAAGYGKEGIVIDVRYNGGGWTTDYLMAVLTVQQHAYTIPRGAAESLDQHREFKETYPFGERLPLAAWTKPSIALCNQNSYSNAEIFSHAYKTLDLGTLVGTPTFGAVISTGGWVLQDGSFVRMPFRGWFVKATEENMEHGPAVPDIVVENPPAYRAKNTDPQLKRAVDELLNQL